MNNVRLNFILCFMFCAATISYTTFASDSSCGSDEDCSHEEMPHYEKIDHLNYFPNPNTFLPLESTGIKTIEEFRLYWEKEKGEIIKGFQSFEKQAELSPFAQALLLKTWAILDEGNRVNGPKAQSREISNKQTARGRL